MDALNLHSYQTAWGMLYKVRRVLAEESKQHLLKEPVTVHALHIGGRPGLPLGNLARRRTAVLLAVEYRRGNWVPHVQLRAVTRVTSATVLRFLKEVVQPSKASNHETLAGANARTAAKAAETAATAATVVEQYRARVQPNGRLDTGVDQTLTVLRAWWGRTHNNGVGTWQIDDALGEFAWYFNTRRVRLRERLLQQLLRRSVITSPGTVNSLAGPPEGVPRSRRPKAIRQRRSAAKRLKPRTVKTFVTVEDAIEL